MRCFSAMVSVVFALVFVCQVMSDEPVGPYLQRISVNVCCPQGSSSRVEGSGTVILSPTKDGPASWVLTAHHVVKDLRDVKSVIDAEGDEKKQILYRDAQVIQEQVAEGRGVGEVKFDAKVVTVDPRRDIALLRVRFDEFAKEKVTFYLGDEIPQPGIECYHVGAPGGKEVGGTCSVTSGIVSRIGVRIPEFGGAEHGIFDQVDCAALGGSSGGLVARKSDGQWLGVLTLGLGGGSDSFHWIVPVRSVREWAKDMKVEWLLDPNLPRPSKEEVDKIPLELNAAGFAGKDVKESPAAKERPKIQQPIEIEPKNPVPMIMEQT